MIKVFPLSILALLALPGSGLAAEAPCRPWTEYHTIMWIGESAGLQPAKLPLFFQRLREMGVNTGMVYDDADPAPLLQNHFPYYVENMVNRGLCLKFNSAVRDWDQFVNGWSKAGRPLSALARNPSLEDAQWRQWARAEVRRLAARHRPNQPLACNLRDELSVTYFANPFDYDFSAAALGGFRRWLKWQYADLAALNAEWETRFASWDEVTPFTTDEIKNRMASGQAVPRGQPDWQQLESLDFDPVSARQAPTRWNFSPWADFRTYMDWSLADVLDDLRRAVHSVDPQTPVGIEGTQMPGAFGGYDLWRLSQAVDWVEPYDIGCAREIFGSFMRGRPIVTTVFESDSARAARRLWHLLLEGDRGCIVWWSEDCVNCGDPAYPLTAKGRALAPVLREMTSPLAGLFLRAEAERDPIFILYSQAGIQVDWLLESRADGSTWPRRFSSYEAAHNQMAQARDGWLKALQDLGYSPQFISTQQVESGQLSGAALVLPSCWALSDKEIQRMRLFAPPAGTEAKRPFHVLLFDNVPGLFDQHGKIRRAAPDDWLTGPNRFDGDAAGYAVERLERNPPAASGELAAWLAERLGASPPAIPLPSNARVRVFRFRAAGGRLLAFERNIEYTMTESLQQAGGNESLEKPLPLDVTLPRRAHLYDLRSQSYLGYTDRLRFTLDPWRPALFAQTASKVPAGSIISALSQPEP
jgi:hypothetical protein